MSPLVFARSRTLWLLLAAVPLAAAVAGVVWYTRAPGPVPPDEQFRQALVALGRGDLNAVAAAATALESDRRYATHVRLLDGALLLKDGQPERALAEFGRLPLDGELRVPGLLLVGESLYRSGRLGEAERVFRRLADEYPDHAGARRWLGIIYYDLGANTAAIAELTRLIELEPDDYKPHRLIGLMHHDFEQNAQAIEHYRQALSLDPPPAVREEVLRELAKSLISERKYAEALASLEPARTDAMVLTLKAECHWSLGRQEEARKALEQARARNPDERLLALLESRILMDERQPERAAAVLQPVLQRNPHDAECRYQLALAYRQLGDSERYEAEMARWQESADLRRRLTELNIKAIEQPRNAAIRDHIADLCQMLGKYELAATWRAAARACRQAQAARSAGPNPSAAENDTNDGT